MISWVNLVSCINIIMHDIIYDIILSYMILDMTSFITMHFSYFLCPALADRPSRPAQRADETDDDREQNRPMDFDEERDFADQGPLTEMDTEEDAEILSLLLKHMPSCIDAADNEQLVWDIPVQPPVVVPVRTVQEAVAAGDLPPLDANAANVFSLSELILHDHFRRHNTNAAELKDLIQRVLHHPNFNADDADTQRDRATAAGSTRWTSGCGATAGAAPRMVSIAEAERIRAERLSKSRTRAAETRKRHSEAAAATGTAQGGGGADWTLENDIIGHIMYIIMYDIMVMSYDIIVMIS
jgi:hypothetical protein